MTILSTGLRHRLGILRSLAIYYWQPGKLRKLRAFFREYLPENALCFDIGAHLGNRTRVWRQIGARVIAVEPQPMCLKHLRHRFRNDQHVTILPLAVADKEGEMPLYVSALTPTISSLAGQDWQADMQKLSSFHVQWDYSVTVPVTTLETLVKEYGIPDFCKIDVEDLEPEVLMGLKTALPLLSFEYLSARIQKSITCIERLQELGTYQYNWSYGESHVMQLREWISAEEAIRRLRAFNSSTPSGDVYARLTTTSDN